MVLVTGGAGLLGSQLITQLLAEGKTVKAIYNHTPITNFHSKNLQLVHCDILDVVTLEEVMIGVDELYHCAAMVSFNPPKKQQMFKINIEGTANMVNAAIDEGVKKMVYVSSVAALGKLEKNKAINETMNWNEENNSSAYGQSKYLAEMEVWRGIGEGLQAVIVNPSIILGASNWEESSSKIFKNIYNEFPWYTTGSNGFVDVKDVAKAMIELMQSNVNAERFIVSAENKTYQQIFNLIANAFHKKQPTKKVTPWIAFIAWRLEKIKSLFNHKDPLLTKETTKTALQNIDYDNTKLFKYLPNFEYTAIEKTIEETCHFYLQQINN